MGLAECRRDWVCDSHGGHRRSNYPVSDEKVARTTAYFTHYPPILIT
jgi:hypothetical protein